MGEYFITFILDNSRGWIGSSEHGSGLITMTEDQISEWNIMAADHEIARQRFLRQTAGDSNAKI